MNTKLIPLLFLLCCLVACRDKDAVVVDEHSVMVKEQTIANTLHFTGNVQPLEESALASPMEAVVESMPYHYGQWVKKGQIIFTLNSTELQKQYNDTLTEYLKAKDSYGIAKAKFNGTQDLWDAGLISKNNYLSEKSSLDTARVTLMQASRKLTDMLDKVDDHSAKSLANLSLSDFDKVRDALSASHQQIFLRAPADGLLLYPPKTGEDKSARIGVGSAVKSGQVLALIGNMQGISLEIDVPEVDIAKIRNGMTASVTGIAFANQSLQGKVVAVNSQATGGAGNSLPSFTAIIEVSKLSESQRQWVKVGMSANIEVMVENRHQLMVPIKALKQDHGQTIVQVKNAKGELTPRPITTGSATADQVIVVSGLKPGEVVWCG